MKEKEKQIAFEKSWQDEAFIAHHSSKDNKNLSKNTPLLYLHHILIFNPYTHSLTKKPHTPKWLLECGLLLQPML